MANRYWVGNGTLWNSTSSWSATSGGVSGATVPVFTDDVFFNGSSGNAVVYKTGTADVATCNNLNCIGFTGSLYGQDIVTPIKIYGSLTLSSTMLITQGVGMQFDFQSNATGRTITSAGQVISYITFDLTGGDVTLLDNITCNQQFFFGNGSGMNAGTVYSNGKTINSTNQGIGCSYNVNGGTFDITNSILNTSQFFACSNLSLITTGSIINMSTSNATFYGANKTYNVINLISSPLTFNGGCTIPNLNVAGTTTLILNSGVTINNLTLSNDVSIASGLTLSNGLVSSNTVSTQRTITLVGGITPLVTREDFRDIRFTPSVNFSVITGGSGDLGNNTGITFSTAQTQYFKSTGTTADFVDATKWFTSSGGVVLGRIPLAQDTAVFDSNSFTGTTTIILNSSINTGSLNFSGITQNVILTNTSYNLNIYGSLNLSSGLTWNFSSVGYLYMKSITNQTIRSNGSIISCNRLYFDGIGGTWTQMDNLLFSNSRTNLVNGTLNTNNFNYYSDGLFDVLAGTKTLNLGSSVFTCVRFRNGNPTNFIFNAGTSTVVINSVGVNDELTGTNIFYNLTIQSTNAVCIVSLDSNQYITNQLTINGYDSGQKRILITSNTIGTTRTITAPNVIASNVDFRDISVPLNLVPNWNLSGITGGSGDCGGNLNITFTSGQTQYWYGGSGNWSDSINWFTQTSGVTQGRVPLPQDDAIFDENSFSGTSTVIADCRRIPTTNMINVNQSVTFTPSQLLECYGSFIVGNNITLWGGLDRALGMYSRTSSYLSLLGKTVRIVSFYSLGVCTLLSDIVTYEYLAYGYGGKVDFNDFNVTTPRIANNGGSGSSMWLGNGTITMAGNTIIDINIFECPTYLYSEGSTIKLTTPSNSFTQIFSGGNNSYNKLWLSGTHLGYYNITGNNTFSELKIDAGRKVRFTAGTTTTVGTLLAEGTSSSGITISSVTASPHTLVKSGTGTVTVNYCTISYSTTSASFRAKNSVNGGSNTGWDFTPNNRYWIGNGGNWSDTAHWSLTSGGISGATIPTAISDVYFDANSFSTGSTVIINAVANCFDMNWTGLDQNVTLLNSAFNLNVYGSLTLWTGLTWAFTSTGYLYLNATDPQYITTNGIDMNNVSAIYFNGVGSWTNLDDWTFWQLIWISGTWNTNNKTITTISINTSLSGTRVWNCGSSSIYTGWLNSNGSPITINAGTSTIYMNGGWFTAGSNNILNDVIVNRNGSITINGGTFKNLTLTNGAVNNTIFSIFDNITVLDNLTLSGYNSTNYRPIVISNTIGSQRKITANNVVASNIDFRDIYLSGSTIFDLSGVVSGDAGGNSGITFTPSQTQYFKHTTGSVNWSDSTKWFTSSGGLAQGRVPLPQDDVFFDENSFSGTSTLTVNVPRIGRSLDMSMVNTGVTMIMVNDIESYGTFVLGDNISSIIGSYTVNLMGRSNYFMNLKNKTLYNITINAPNANYINLSSFTLLYQLTVGSSAIYSTLDLNDFDITVGVLFVLSYATIYLGNGTINITLIGTTAVLYFHGLSNLFAENSTIKFSAASGTQDPRITIGENKILNKMWISGTHSGNYDLDGLSTTISELKIDAGRKVRFNAGTTTSITKSLSAVGTSTSGITLTSVNTGSTHTLLLTSGATSDVKYSTISYSVATNPLRALNSTNGGNNTGWTFPSSKYWIGGSGNWNDLTHWSTTSGGVSGETLGIERVTNGTFDTDTGWNKGVGCTISGGTLNMIGNGISTIQNSVFVVGKAYKISFTITNLSVGSGQLSDSDGTTYMSFSSNGSYSTSISYISGVGASPPYYYPKNTALYIGVYNGSYSIDNISVKEILSIPTSGDTVYFDQNSFTGTSTVTINALANCLDMIWTGITQNVTLQNAAYNLNVYGSLELATGLTWTFTSTGYLYFKSTTFGNYIKTNGVISAMNNVFFDGAGGYYTNYDDWDVTNGTTRITMYQGTWNTNDKTITVFSIESTTQVGIKVLNLGSSTIYCSYFTITWPNTPTLTFNCGTSHIIFLDRSLNAFYSGERTFYDVTNLGAGSTDFLFYKSTYHNLSLTPSTRLQIVVIVGDITITNNFTVVGLNSTTSRSLLPSNILGTQRKIIVDPSKSTFSNVDFRDIYLSGSTIFNLSGITGGSGDAGGNSGITFTPSQTQYFKHSLGAVNWGDLTKWVTSSGGLTQGRVPLPQDSAIFDENSFSGTSSLYLNVLRIPNIDLSATVPIVNVYLSNGVSCYGDFIIKSGISYSTTGGYQMLILEGRNGNYNISTFNILGTTIQYSIRAINGRYSLQSDLYFYEAFSVDYGTLDLNDFNLGGYSVGYFTVAINGTLYMGNGTITIRRNYNNSGYGVGFGASGMVYCEGSTIKYELDSIYGAWEALFAGGGRQFNKLWISGNHNGNHNLLDGKFNELIIDAGRKVRFLNGITTTIGKLTAIGTLNSGITLTSTVSGATTNLVLLSGETSDVRYANISYSNITPTTAARESINSGGNSGWTFTTGRYWIGGTGNWNDPSHWSATSGGLATEILSSECYTGGDFEGVFPGGSTKADGFGSVSTWTSNSINPISGTKDGLLTVTTGSNNGRPYLGFYTDNIILANRYVKIVFQYKVNSGNPVINSILYGGNIISVNYPLTTGVTSTYTGYVMSAGQYNWFNIYLNTQDGNSIQIDNVSIKEVLNVPNSTYDAFFDQNSFTGTSTVTINTNSECFDLNFSGITQNVTFLNSAYNLNVYGSLTLWTGLTWNFTSTGYLYLKANTTQSITTNGIILNCNRLYMDGVGGSWTNQDDLITNGLVRSIPINGIWNTNGKSIYVYSIRNLAGYFILNAGGSFIYLQQFWQDFSTMIFNCNTSTIVFNYSLGIPAVGSPYYNIIVNNGNVVGGYVELWGDIVVLNELTIIGYNDTDKRTMIMSNTLGNSRKITVNSVVASNVDFRDIYLSGSTTFDLSGITGGSGDAGGNSGITFTPSQTQYFKHTSGAVNWSDSTKWFTSSGGLVQGRVPLPQDDVYFDENSFSGTSTLTVNVPRIGKSLDMSLVDTGVTMVLGNSIECYGSFILGNNINLSTSNNPIYLIGRSSYYLKPYNSTVYQYFIYLGTYTALSDINMSAIPNCFFTLRSGIFDLNDFNMTSNYVIQQQYGTFYFGNGTLTTPAWALTAGTVIPESSTLKLIATGSANIPFNNLNPMNFNKVWFSGDVTGSYDITGGYTNTFNELVIDAGRKVRIANGTTTTINKLLSVNGTSASGVTISSITSGSTHTLLLSSGGTADVKYANISYSNATNPITARQSTDLGGNSGWTFSPSRYWIGGTGNWNDLSHWSATSGGLSGTTLGNELITDDNSRFFNTGLGYWVTITNGNGVLTHNVPLSAATLTVGSTPGSYTYGRFQGLFNTISGRTYKATVDIYIVGITGGTVNVGDMWYSGPVGSTQSVPLIIGSWQTVEYYFISQLNTTWGFDVKFNNNTAGVLHFDNVSIKEVYSIPISVTDVIFDQNSFSGTSTVTINSLTNCNTMDWTGINQNVTLQNSAYNLNVYGSLGLVTGLTWLFTSTGYLYFKSTTIGNFIRTDGVVMNTNQLYFDGTGGTWSNLDDMNLGSSIIRLVNGTWNTNSKNITTTGLFDILAGTKTLTLGSSIFKVGIWSDYNALTTTGLTLNCDTSTVWITSFVDYYGTWFNTNSSTFYNLKVTGRILTIQSIVSNLNITNLLTISGSTLNRVIVSGGQTGAGGFASVKNISAKNVDISHTDFLNIKALGEANWDVSNVDGFSSDLGGNSGITFAPSQTLYFNHTSGSCIWDDSSKWFLSDRITPGRIPLGHDDVVFDELSFSGVSSVNITSLHNSLCRNFNSLNINQSVDFTTTTGKYFTGNIDFNSLTTPNFYLNLYALKSCYINTNNKTLSLGAINDTATYNLMSDFTGHLLLGAGTFNTNNYNMNLVGSGLYLINQNVTFNAGSSIINLVNSNFTISMTSVFNCGTSIFNFTGTTTNSIFNQAVPFASPLIFNEVNIYNTGSYIFSINKEATFNKLNIINGTVKFSGDTTYSLGSLTTVNSGTTITSMVSGSKHILQKIGSGLVDVNYANISYSTVSGSTLTARNSTDLGGNTNWIFPAKRYWIGGTGNWSDPSHWSNSSGGLSGTTSLGTNVIKNGTFDSPDYWDLWANFNISGGTLNCNTAIQNYASQTTIDIITGRTYHITFTISSYTSGWVAVQIGLNSFGSFSGLGTFSGYTTTNTWNTLYFSTAAFVGSIDNVILREVVSVPTESSDVIFDQNSFSGTSVVTVNTGATCLTMDWENINQSVTFLNTLYTLNLYGSLILSTGLTWTFNNIGHISVKTSSSMFIDTKGTSMEVSANGYGLYFDGTGTYELKSSLILNGNPRIQINSGVFNSNSYDISCNQMTFLGTSIINMGSSTFSTIIYYCAPTVTFNCGTSTLKSLIGAYLYGMSGGNKVYYNIEYTGQYTGYIDSILSCNNFTFTTYSTYLNFNLGSDLIVNNTLTISGLTITTNRAQVNSTVIGTQRKITANNVVLQNVDFRDIYLSGSTIWNLSGITGLSGDAGGNSGITFTPAQTQYWYQGTGSWSNFTKWFTETNGGGVQGRVPLPQDSAIFDENSFSGTSILTVDVSRIGSLDMSLINTGVTMTLTNAIECYGDYILSNNVTQSGNYYNYLYGRGLFSLNLYDKIIYALTINNKGGIYTNYSNITCTRPSDAFNLYLGTFDFNDFDFSGYFFYAESGILYLGNGIFTLGRLSLYPFYCTSTLYCEGSTILLSPQSGSGTVEFAGNSKIYNKIQLSGIHNGHFIITGSNNINELSIDAGKSVKFTEGTTTTVNHLIAEGTATSGITITSVTSGSTHTLVKTGTGAINVKYATISYSNASTPNVFRTRRSTNLIGNTGWVFPPQKYWIGGSGTWNDITHWSDTSGGSGITETLGPELCLNSNFTTTANWSLTANVSINTGLGVCSFLNASGVNGVIQNVMTFGKSYKCTVEIKNYVIGQVYVTDGNTSFGPAFNNNGTFSYIFTPISPNIYIMAQGVGLTTLDLDSVSVKEVTNFLNSGTTVYLDQNSFSAPSTVSINGSQLVCLDMDWTGINQSVLLSNPTSYNAYIYGSLNLATGLTWSFSYAGNYLYFRGIQTGNFIKTNGIQFGGINHTNTYIQFDGIGGSWCNLDDMYQNVSGVIYVTNGIWNTNDKTIYIPSYISGFAGGGLSLGSSTVTFGNGFGFSSGFQLTGGTSTIIASGDWGNANGQTLYNVILNQAYQNFGGYYGGFTCKNLTRTGGNSTLNATPLFSDIIVTDTFTINGYSPSIRTIIYSWTLGTQRKITASNVIASNVDFRDIYLSGSTIWNLSGITGGSGDAGGNSGITFTPSQTQYWHVGAGTWSNVSKWFTQTNGIGTGRVPLPQDDIIFDENSFDSGGTITIDIWRIGRSLNMSRVNTGVTLISTINYEVYGSFILGNNITLSSSYQTWLMGRGFFNFNLYNRGSIFLNVNAYNGVYTNGSSFTTGGDNVWFWSGTFDFNDYDCNLYNFISGTDNSSVIVKFGNGTITFFRSSASALFRSYSSNQLDFENSTLKFIPTGSDNLNLTFGDEKFNKVWFSGGHTGNFDISGNNSFNEIKIDAGRKVRFTAGTSQSISRLIALGKPSNLITIGSIVSGSTHTLNSLPNDWLVDYCNIQDSITVPNRHVGINSVKSAQFDTSSNTIGWNLNEFSQNFNLWTKTNINTLTGFTAPDNTNSAIKISVSNITNNTKGLVLGVYVPINNIYTVSVYAKAAEYTKLSIAEGYGGRYSATFNLSSGSVISTIAGVNAGMESVGNGWFRCFVTSSLSTINLYTTIAGYPDAGAVIGVYDVQYTGTLNSGVYIWGPQLVNGYDKLPYFLTSSKIRYWVGNSGTSTDTAHWSLQANGVSGATIPTSSESVVFDRYSFTSTGQTVTLSGNTNVAYLHMDDVPSGLTLSSIYDLNVYDSIYLASGMTFDVNNLYFKSPYTGNIINTNNTILNTNEIYFDNATGMWLNGDNFTTTANIHHINGNWSVNRIVTIKNYLLGVGTKTLLLDSSTFNVQNFDIKTNSTNFTVTPSTSKIIATSGVTMLSQTLYDVQTNSFDAISPTVHNLTLSGDTWVVAGIPIITGTLQIDGNSSTDRFLLKSDTLKTQRTITAQNTMMSNVDIIDIKGNDWNLTGTSIGDGGGNTGITFTPATTQYWNQGSGDWSDLSKWTSRVPLLQDTAVFDENSFTGTSTLNINMTRISSINMSGVTQQVTLNDMNVYGDISLNDYVKVSNLYLYGRNNYLNLSGDTNVFMNGNYTNQSNFKSNSLTLLDGTFSLGNYTLEVNSWYVSGITIPNNSVIKFNSTGSTNFTFNGGNNNYYNLWLSGTHTGYYDIFGNNRFNNIKIDDGRKVRFESNSTQTINSLSAQAISGITITSTSTSQHTLIFNQYNPFLVFNYLDLSYSKVLPLDRIYAVSSINSGNNTGWLFTNSPLFVWIQSNWGILVDENGKFLW